MLCRLQIGTKNELATLTQGFLHVQPKRIHKIIFMVQNGQIILADQLLLPPKSTGRQHRGNRNLVKVRLNKAPFAIRLLVGKPVHDGLGEMPRVNTHATVLIIFAIYEVGLIPFGYKIEIFNLIGAHTVILNTDNVCILLGQPVEETFINSPGKTIDAD